MPDYASILRRSISALPDPTPEMREAVYQRARAALARQLTAVEPPLSTREIETQHQDLEDAVQRLESEFAPLEPISEPIFDEAPEEPVYYAAPQGRGVAYAEEASESEGDFGADAPAYEQDPELEDEDEFEEDEREPSRLPLIAALAVLILVVVGVGAYGYANRDTFFGFLGGEDQVSVVNATPAPVETPDVAGGAADDSDKEADRLTNGSETPAQDVALAEPDTAPVLPIEPPADAAAPEGEQTAALPPADEGLVAQRAIYYFQGAEGSPGRAVEGSVTWVETTRENAPAVQATLRLAEPEVTAIVTIYRNNDTSLPASHMVEVEFQGTLGTTAIQRVPALVLKSTEQARGEPLAGAAVPVTDELFWIALSDEAEEETRNITLLREGAWFDIPILFTDGTRALLTFEKGVPGDRVFDTVMSAWTPA